MMEVHTDSEIIKTVVCNEITTTKLVSSPLPTAPFVALCDQSSSVFLMHDGDEFSISMGWQSNE